MTTATVNQNYANIISIHILHTKDDRKLVSAAVKDDISIHILHTKDDSIAH